MLKLFGTAALATAIAMSGAIAADMTATGTIKTMDATKCTVELSDGHTYQFAPKCDFSKLKANEKVTITHTMKGTTYEASKVTAG
ncbi:hypothetical protein VW35_07270 [Devosia soli]|uniref:DUF1344 domain-containing protein n=1 Tax=Devosia soli TaxID=361041 RepID=A0A0F5LCU8_9HYPH|nr:DUF1344 domain-containing protein [Devosia soli]KKB80211.1 hypothetical protein VW35_07270 [Devosia soli]